MSDADTKVLIVDDEPAVCSVLLAAFEGERWKTTAVESAEAALEAMKTTPFDVLLVDKNLPGMNGLELIRAVRRTNANMSCIVMTGYASHQSAFDSIELGIDGYLEKPFADIFAVAKRVGVVLERREKRKLANALSPAHGHYKRAVEHLRAPPADHDAGVVVLVATTNAHEAAWMTRQLRDLGCAVRHVTSEEALFAALAETPSQALLLDGEFPLQRAAAIREIAPDMVWAGVEARQPPLAMLVRLVDLGIRQLVPKPLEPASFDERMRVVIALARASGNGPP